MAKTSKDSTPTPEARPATETIPVEDRPIEQEPLPPLAEQGGVDPSNFQDAERVTVKTTGKFMLLDIFSGEQLTEEEKEVPLTPFITEALERKHLEMA